MEKNNSMEIRRTYVLFHHERFPNGNITSCLLHILVYVVKQDFALKSAGLSATTPHSKAECQLTEPENKTHAQSSEDAKPEFIQKFQ